MPTGGVDQKDGRGVVPTSQRSTNTKGEHVEFYFFYVFSHPLPSNHVDRISDPVRMVPVQPNLAILDAAAWMSKGGGKRGANFWRWITSKGEISLIRL